MAKEIDYEQLGSIDLKNVLDRFEANLLKKLNCVKVGKIKSFYADSQTADIQIDEYPLISGVPVSFICGANFSIQVPVEEGDDCIVLFCDGDLDNWVKGSGYVPAFPRDRHGLNGAIALLGLKNALTKIDNYITSGVRIKYKGSEIELNDNGIVINGNVTVNGTIKSTGEITGTGSLGEIKLTTHVHGNGNQGSDTTQPKP